MKRLLGENASSGLKSANGLGRAAAERGGDFCAAAAEERSEGVDCRLALSPRILDFCLKTMLR
jgi:hypothetical protein